MDFLERVKKLLEGKYYKEIIEDETFTFMRSVFKDASYNFIIPKVDQEVFNWDYAKEHISSSNGYEFSYYIPEKLKDSYVNRLFNQEYKFQWCDVYMRKYVDKPYELADNRYIEINTEWYQRYFQLVEECFPGYDNNKEYCDFCFSLQRDYNKNLLLVEENEAVASGSVLFLSDVNLAYLHNGCTSPKFRRQGFHTEMIKKRINTALELGISEVFANVEENGASHKSFIKLGFQPEIKLFLYSK